MRDLIDRQLAIEAHYEYCNKHPDAGFPVWSLKILEDLPSAQTEPCECAVSAIAVEEMLKDLLPARGMWEIEGDDAKNAICETVHDALEGLWKLPFVKPDSKESSSTRKALDTISRRETIDALDALCDRECEYSKKQRSVMCGACHLGSAFDVVEQLPSAQPERLTDDDFETIRIHLNAYKEKLCNQQRWEEADEYQRIIDRFMAFASAQPKIEERKEESAQNVLKDDSVSRKAAIDAVNGVIADYIPTLYGRYEALPLEMAMAIKRLPTAQPEIVRCKDCKYWGKRGLCDKWDNYISNDDFYCGCAERREG